MEKVINFLRIISIYGDGDRSGDGYGYVNGSRDGSGVGYGGGEETRIMGRGLGYGGGEGYGYGSGDGGGGDGGDGLKSLNNQSIYIIDSIQTIITAVKNNIAKGFIVNSDLSLTSCYIAKGENQFAHGKTIKEAISALQTKLLQTSSIENRIIKFREHFKSTTIKYKAVEFYNWHTALTGSCTLGKEFFCKNKNINLNKDKFTIKEFIELTKNNYGSNIILQLEQSYE